MLRSTRGGNSITIYKEIKQARRAKVVTLITYSFLTCFKTALFFLEGTLHKQLNIFFLCFLSFGLDKVISPIKRSGIKIQP